MEQELQIVLYEDVPADAEAIEQELHRMDQPLITRRVATLEQYRQELERGKPEIILADYSLAGEGEVALRLARERYPDVPFIYVSSVSGEEAAIAALKSGAADYILKRRLWQLAPAVECALRETDERHERLAAEEKLHQSEIRLRGILRSLKETLVAVLDPQGKILATWMDEELEKRLGVRADNLLGKTFQEWAAAESPRSYLEAVRDTFENGRHVIEEALVQGVQGEVWVEISFSPIRDDSREISAVLAVVRDVSGRKRAEEAMQVAQRRLDSAREQERRRVAREIHDSIGQQIGVLRLQLRRILLQHESSMNPALVEDLNKVSEQCNELMDEVRAISYGLYPPLLEALGLAACLHQMARDSRTEVPIEVQCDESLEKARFDDEVEIALYRVAQEATSNALRHGHARGIKVQLRRGEGPEIILTISDDGIGFQPSESIGQGLGLNAMRERARSVGGEFLVESRPGRTQVQVRVEAAPREAPAFR